MSERRGILLAGGTGTRLYPITHGVSKQLVPVYNKPMVYYPLCTLMLAGIRRIRVITTPRDRSNFERALGDGSQWGLDLSYQVQERPDGIAHALLLARDFLGGNPSALVLGDNLFYGHELTQKLQRAAASRRGATIFGHWVRDPERYGVIAFGPDGQAIGIEEKPESPPSNYAVTGLYFYDGRAPDFAAELRPSDRGELEVTDLNRRYLKEGNLTVELLGRGFAWLDTGTHDALLAAANFVRTVEERQGLRIACVEEVAFRMGYIDARQLLRLAEGLQASGYGEYLLRVARQPKAARGHG